MWCRLSIPLGQASSEAILGKPILVIIRSGDCDLELKQLGLGLGLIQRAWDA